MRNERDLDDAIDRAVLDIMEAEPRAGFRGRVLGRLALASGGPSWTAPAQGRWVTLPRFAAAMAVLAVAIAVAALLRTAGGPHVPAAAPVVAQKEPAAPAEARPVVADAPALADRQARTPRRAGSAVGFPPRGIVAAASVVDRAASTPEAPPDPAVPGTGSEFNVVTPAPLVIAPLTIPPIVIPPIRPPQ